MPNWCSNNLEVYGERAEIEKFKVAVETEESCLDFNKIHPMPEDFKGLVIGGCEIDGTRERMWRVIGGKNVAIPQETIEMWQKQYGCAGWYDWCIANWGTKWDASDPDVCDNGDGLIYHFDTAWSPPIQWLEYVSKKFPTLEFKMKYEEEGMGFMGCARASEGSVHNSCCDC